MKIITKKDLLSVLIYKTTNRSCIRIINKASKKTKSTESISANADSMKQIPKVLNLVEKIYSVSKTCRGQAFNFSDTYFNLLEAAHVFPSKNPKKN